MWLVRGRQTDGGEGIGLCQKKSLGFFRFLSINTTVVPITLQQCPELDRMDRPEMITVKVDCLEIAFLHQLVWRVCSVGSCRNKVLPNEVEAQTGVVPQNRKLRCLDSRIATEGR